MFAQAIYEGHAFHGKIRSSITGVSTMKEDFQGWKLPAHRETLGVATVGDRLHVLIPAQKPIPAAAFQVHLPLLPSLPPPAGFDSF